MISPLIIGSRGSLLARTQAEIVKKKILTFEPSLDIQIKTIKTAGDIFEGKAIPSFGGKGIFVKEIEDHLLNGDIHLAVHSMKDVPTELPPGLEICATLKRDDASDAFLSNDYASLKEMPKDATVATSSLRRKVQVKHEFPHLKCVDIRGNIDTRLKKLEDRQFDALIMASCGLDRLGFSKKVKQRLKFIPAVGQGALGVEIKSNQTDIRNIVLQLNDEQTFQEVKIERIFLKHMGGGCLVPLGARANCTSQVFILETFIASLDGDQFLSHKEKGSLLEVEKKVFVLSEKVLNAGGRKILERLERGSE